MADKQEAKNVTGVDIPNPPQAVADAVARVIATAINSGKGRWIRRLHALAAVVEQLRNDDVPNDNDPVLEYAEKALQAHIDKIVDVK